MAKNKKKDKKSFKKREKEIAKDKLEKCWRNLFVKAGILKG